MPTSEANDSRTLPDARTIASITPPAYGFTASIIAVCGVLLLPLAGTAGHASAYLLCSLWALRGHRQAIEALSLTWLLTYLNPGIYPSLESATVLRWLVVISAFTSVHIRFLLHRKKVTAPLLALSAFSFYAAVASLAVSPMADVSIFKLASFFMVASTVLIGFQRTAYLGNYWLTWYSVYFGVVLIFGLPFHFTEAGYFVNGRGFQGLLNQPQVMATFVAPILAFLVAKLIFQTTAFRFGAWLLLVVSLTSLVLSEGRVGVIATMIGVGAALAWWATVRLPRTQFVSHVKIASGVAIIALVIVVAGLNYPSLKSEATDFMLKTGRVSQEATSLGEALWSTRGHFIEASLSNFQESPIVGIGFGVPSSRTADNVSRLPIIGIPTSAPAEKGFLPAAVLEEVGLVGVMLLTMLVLTLLFRILRYASDPAPIAMFVAALAVNLGESVFFAAGGSGTLMWLMVALAITESYRGSRTSAQQGGPLQAALVD